MKRGARSAGLLGLLGLLASEARGDEPSGAPADASVVRGRARREEPGSTVVTAREAAAQAGAGGDALKGVDSAAGVARPAPGATQPVIWGAAPSESKVLVDGVEIPSLLHAGGLRGVLAADLVETIELLPAAFPAEIGRALGGALLLTTRPLPDAGVHGRVSVDLADAGGSLSVALGGRLRVAVAGRYGYLDRLVENVLARAGDPGAARLPFAVPAYHDWQAKVQLSLRPGEELTLLLLGAADRLRVAVEEGDPAGLRARTLAQSFQRLSLRYASQSPDGSVLVQPFVGRDSARREEAAGQRSSSLDDQALRYGLRASWRRRLLGPGPVALWVLAGLDAQGEAHTVARDGSLTIPPREGDRTVFGRPPGDDVARDEFRVHQLDVAPYLSLSLRTGPLLIQPGLRLDALLVEGSRLTPRAGATPPVGFSRLAVALEPRISATVRLGALAQVSAAFGVSHQPPAPVDLGAVFGNPTLPAARAIHATASLSARPLAGFTIEAAGFLRQLDGLAARSTAAAPPLAAALDATGEGRVHGVQLALRQEARATPVGQLSASLSYTLSRALRRDHPGDEERLFDFDQTHVLTLLAGWSLRGVSLGGRLRYATGMPRPDLVGVIYDAHSDSFQPLLGPAGSSRLPDFLQVDGRLGYVFTVLATSVEAYLDVQNLANRRNAEEVVYRYDYSARGYLSGLPLLAIAGLRVER